MQITDFINHETISGVNTTAMSLMIILGHVFTNIFGLHKCKPFRKLKDTRKALVVGIVSLIIALAYMIDDVLSWQSALTTFGMANTVYAVALKNFLTTNTKEDEQDQANSTRHPGST